MEQLYKNYTQEDHEVWKILYDRQVLNLQGKACKEYLDCVKAIKTSLDDRGVPDFRNVDQTLLDGTGWSIEVVKGLIPVEEFFPLLANRRFCSSTWIRSRAQLDYLEEPDMFHDTFGHLPLLLDKTYAAFVQRFGALGAQHVDNESVITALQRLYWFTIEFGLMKGVDKPLIYGAGILSSFGESNHIYEGGIEVLPFDLNQVIRNHFINSEIQMRYYLIDSFDQLYHSLDEMEELIEKGLDIAPQIVR